MTHIVCSLAFSDLRIVLASYWHKRLYVAADFGYPAINFVFSLILIYALAEEHLGELAELVVDYS
jgi:hypothetical protein